LQGKVAICKDAKVAKGEILMHIGFKKISRILGVLGDLARDRTYALRLTVVDAIFSLTFQCLEDI
jgi:hypothetical protein